VGSNFFYTLADSNAYVRLAIKTAVQGLYIELVHPA
jgi:hypothetical protein